MKCSPCILGHNSFLVDESGHTNLSTDNDAFLRTLKCVSRPGSARRLRVSAIEIIERVSAKEASGTRSVSSSLIPQVKIADTAAKT